MLLKNTLQEIRNTEQKCGRNLESVSLLVVSKNQPVDRILPLLQSGYRLFGENRVQEASSKWPHLRGDFSDIQLHLIGPLQTNKVSQALELFDVIETLDRPHLAENLAKKWSPQSRTKEFFIQVNTGAEPQKAGVTLTNFREFFDLATQTYHLPVTGLMCIPPVNGDPVPHFTLLADLARDYALPNLSMGMSSDFPLAIACGSTQVRIGTLVFGGRP